MRRWQLMIGILGVAGWVGGCSTFASPPPIAEVSGPIRPINAMTPEQVQMVRVRSGIDDDGREPVHNVRETQQ